MLFRLPKVTGDDFNNFIRNININNPVTKDTKAVFISSKIPKTLLDPKKEFIAVEEARVLGIPVIAIANTDCKISTIDYPIVANDSSRSSVDYILHQLLG